MVVRKSTVKVGICICPLTVDEKQHGIQNIVHTEENEIKISMGTGKGQKSYEADFEVCCYCYCCCCCCCCCCFLLKVT